ncbi:MAG: trehalose-6-phosphate synthase [Phycisphaerae bacterium]|nr:trehalose-6-phosphate synthase [Phycisphaerae bacterium]
MTSRNRPLSDARPFTDALPKREQLLGRGRRLVIAANRLPVHRVARGSEIRWESSAGGLVTALVPVVQSTAGVWVGWSGESGRAPRAFEHDGVQIKPLSLTADEVRNFYDGFSNRTLWPLYHDAIRTPEFHRPWWNSYVAINQRFARALARHAGRRDVVWIQDYHLQLVPQMLRALRPDVTIGVFMHIPFPPEELFEWLPWRRQILEGMLGADLLGFQTSLAAQNFSRACRHHDLAEGVDSRLEMGNREILVRPFPISIDFDWFQSRAEHADTRKAADEIRQLVGPTRKILLAVDRLDYTKGIQRRLLVFEEMLKRKLISIDNCVLIQIAVPSREAVDDYARIRADVEETVGRINGEHSQPGRVAVHYFRRNFLREDLAAYYRVADVMVVTPLRDGMNLVAKEFVACRTETDGVLVLSEFAGAARELRQAVIVNPRDTDGLIASLLTALRMPKSSQRLRMAALRSVVRRHDVHAWAQSFLEAVPRPPSKLSAKRPTKRARSGSSR